MVDIEGTRSINRDLLAERAELHAQTLLESGRQAQPDLPVGVVVKQAVEYRMNVQGVVLAQESYIHIGTPDNLIAVTRKSPW